jgi:hypothetical protein
MEAGREKILSNKYTNPLPRMVTVCLQGNVVIGVQTNTWGGGQLSQQLPLTRQPPEECKCLHTKKVVLEMLQILAKPVAAQC